MRNRLLIASPEIDFQNLMKSMLEAAMELIPLNVTVDVVSSRDALLRRLAMNADDTIFLDWTIAGAGTPELMQKILHDNPRLRVVALLPLHLRQYRQSVWDAGACNSVPKEHMDQEWLSSLLCVMWRAMEREKRKTPTSPIEEEWYD